MSTTTLASASASASATIVTLHSKLTAISSKPFGSGKSHRLSGLDHAMGSHTVHTIWYYKDEDNLFRCFDLDCLRESLSKVLSMYPAMTGRLGRGHDGNWQVRCNDAGVRIIQATVGTTLHHWLASASASQEALLIHCEHITRDPPSTTCSPFVIQINCFEGGGVAVGLSCNHMLADITSAASFFKSWAQTHRHVTITNQPSFTLPLHAASPSPVPNGDANYTPPSESVSPTEASSENMAKATFKFSSSIIKQCLSQVHDMCPSATPFDFLSALFWTRIVHLKPPKNHDDDQTHSLSICTDFRRFLKKAPCPSGYFGNALHFSNLSLNVKDHMDSDRLGVVVSEVHRHLEGIEEEEIWSSIERFESQKESPEGGKFISPSCMYGPELTCLSMEHLIEDGEAESLLYEAVFSNDEKPVHVSCHVGNVVGEGLIMVVPSSEGGLARTVVVMLPQEELAELSKDQAILQLQPTTFFTDIVAEL